MNPAINGEVPAWFDLGACRAPGIDSSIFFPGQGEDGRPAKQICDTCPVTAECLTFALDNGERFGIWGGTSQRERSRLRRDMRRTAA